MNVTKTLILAALLAGGGSMRAGESAAAAAAPAVAAEGDWTLLQKMDFEKPGSQTPWQEDRGSRKTNRVAFALADDAHSGKQALRLTLVNPEPPEAEAPKSCTVFVGVPLTPREEESRLRVRLFVKGFDGETNPDAVFSLIPRNAKEIVAYKPEWGKVPSGNEWQEVTLETKLPAGVKTLGFLIRCRKFMPGAQLFIDDVSFEVK